MGFYGFIYGAWLFMVPGTNVKAVPSVRDQGFGRPLDDSAAGKSTDQFTRSWGSWFEPAEA